MKKVIFYGIFVLMAYLMVEGTLRVVEFFFPLPILFNSSYHRFKGTPNADIYGYRLNTKGYKDKEFERKDSRTYRIVGIGDSFTFGVTPYPNNFLTIAEEQINAGLPEKRTELYNMGIPGIGPPDYLSVLKGEAFEWQPDMVLVNFFVGNDFQNSSRSSRKKMMHTLSYTGTLIYSIYKILTKTDQNFREEYLQGIQNYCDSCRTLTTEEYLKLQTARSYIFDANNTYFESDLSDAVFYLEKMKSECSKTNTDMIVCIIPDESQVNFDLQNAIRRRLKVSNHEVDWDNSRPNRRLSEELKKRGIYSIDLLPVFTAFKDSVAYVPQDSHWNIFGNRLGGEHIAREIKSYLRGEVLKE